jgi:hypothetical protein
MSTQGDRLTRVSLEDHHYPVLAGIRGHTLLWLLLLSLLVAYSTPMQLVGCNESAHYSLVESLAEGHPSIDAYHWQSCDVSYIHGHYYAAKAPGLALASLPWFLLLKASGLVPKNPHLAEGFPAAMHIPRWVVWEVRLWSLVVPALVLVVLLFVAAERLVPGTGVALGGITGLGTLILPFTTTYFAHVLSATLAFAAFVVLLLEARAPPSRRRLFVAGLIVGLGVVVEYSVALVAVALGFYAATRRPRVSRLAAYCCGGFLGVLPLAAFNLWAFGSPFSLSYENAVIDVGSNGHAILGANDRGFFGVGMPHLRAALELLFSEKGLLILSPVLSLAVFGVLLLYRQGARREAWLIGSLAGAFLVYNAGYYLPFGGGTPGPRFLVPVIPFVALALAPLLKRLPLTTLALGLVSVGAMVIATAAGPTLIPDGDRLFWLRAWGRGGDFQDSFLSLAGFKHSWLALSPLLAAVAVALFVIVLAIRAPWRLVDAGSAATALAAWLLMLRVGPDLLHAQGSMAGALGMLTIVLLVCSLLVLAAHRRPTTVFAAFPLGLLVIPGVEGRVLPSLTITASTLLLTLFAEGDRWITIWDSRLWPAVRRSLGGRAG